MKLYDFPIIRILLFFVLGIVLSYYFPIAVETVLYFVLIVLGIYAFVYFKTRNVFEPKRRFGIALYVTFFILGYFTNTIHTDASFKNHYSHFESLYQNENEIILIIRDKLKNTKKHNRYYAQIESINNKHYQGRILLNIQKNDIASNLISGTRIKVKSYLVKNFKVNNPNQFDYNKYLETKNIYAQVFVRTEAIFINQTPVKDLYYYVSKFRNTISENLTKKNFKKEELAVVMALILGQQQDISPEVIRDYQFAGAVHILSVSGLHVGFILLFVTFLLSPFPNTKRYNTIRLSITLTLLWLFAITAGLAPSVLRATTMFSFVATGMYLKRHTNTYHTIAVSLFIILLFEPHFLFDVGFQLSYLALFFIIWVQPLLKSIWEPKNKIVKYLWEILTVSFAAQIGTLPLSLYYFHQFPGLFFVTNLILIPFMTIIMSLGVLLVILAYFDITPYILLIAVEKSITLVNLFIKKVASAESFIIQNIPFSLLLLILSFVCIISLTLYFEKPNYKKLVLGLTSILCLQIGFIYTFYNSFKKDELIVYSVSKNNLITIRKGENISLYQSTKTNKEDYGFNTIQSYITANFLKLNKVEVLKNVLYFKDKKIIIVDSDKILNLSFSPDIVIIANSPKINLERMLDKLKPLQVVATNTNHKNFVSQLESTCKKLKIQFHSTFKDGYFKLD